MAVAGTVAVAVAGTVAARALLAQTAAECRPFAGQVAVVEPGSGRAIATGHR